MSQLDQQMGACLFEQETLFGLKLAIGSRVKYNVLETLRVHSNLS